MIKIIRITASLTIFIFLTACGGGGGPTANSVRISDNNGGDTLVGDTLTGHYSYQDNERDVEGVSTFRWLRNNVVISGENELSYLVVSADSGQAISFEITPVALTGDTLEGAAVSSPAITVSNSIPVASGVSIRDDNGGSPVVGDRLSGIYTYSDADGDSEGSSSYRWLRNGLLIAGENTSSYTLQTADSGTSVTFQVRPIAVSGNTNGLTVNSNVVTIGNTPPIANLLSITNVNGSNPVVGDLLNGTYVYADVDGDSEGATSFRWLRNGEVIDGAITSTYTPAVTDSGNIITFEVTPVAATGNPVGFAVKSLAIRIQNSSPTASSVTILDDNGGTYDVDDRLAGSYIYADVDGDSEGDTTFQWLRNGMPINGASALSYTLDAADRDALVSFEVTPVATSGELNGTAVNSTAITVSNVVPSASITGIPDPSWGPIHPINTLTPARPAVWPEIAVAGYYYVDNTHAAATNSLNPYGTPNVPRVTIPTPLPAGSVVEVHGIFNNRVTINAQGTVDNPVFVRGESASNKPQFGLALILQGSYLIVENILTQPRDSVVCCGNSGLRIQEGNHHIAVRNSEISGLGNLEKTGTIAIGNHGYSGAGSVEHVVLHNLYIHDIGDVNATFDQDAHGITVNGTAHYIWLLNSEITRTSGDGMQIEAQHSRGRDKIHHIYAGKNTIYNNKQTGLWVKHAHDVIFSENIIRDMAESGSSSGQCMGYQYSGDYVWFINNRLSNCYTGIAAESGDTGEQTNVYYIGNVINNMNSISPLNPHLAGGIKIRMNSANHYVVNNTIVDTDMGVSAPLNLGRLFLYNNIIASRNEPDGRDIYIESAASNSEVDNNIIFNSIGERIVWNGTYTSLTAFTTALGKCTSCQATDPLFVDVVTNDYHVQASSPAVNSGTNSSVYADFNNRYGFPLDKDIDGNIRTIDGIDIGAYETPKHDCTLEAVRCVGAAAEYDTSGADVRTVMQSAIDAALPGDTVAIRGGTYQHSGNSRNFLTVAVSGIENNPITIEPYNGEQVNIKGYGFVDGQLTTPTPDAEIIVQVTGDYIVMRGFDISGSTRYGLDVSGNFGLFEHLTVHHNWLTNVTIGVAQKSVEGNLVRWVEAHHSQHGGGIAMTRQSSNPFILINNRIEESMAYNNGFLDSGEKVPGCCGDGSGGGNSDGMGTSVGCHNYASLAGVENSCPANIIKNNIVWHNADDGIDVSFGTGSVVGGNISFDSGPMGNKGFKGFVAVRGGVSFIGNIALDNGDHGIQPRFDTEGYIHHNVAAHHNHPVEASRGIHAIYTTPDITKAKMYNNLAFANKTNQLIRSISGGGAVDLQANWTSSAVSQIGDATFTKAGVNTNFPAGLSNPEKVAFIRDQFKAAFSPIPGSGLIDAGVFIPGLHCVTADDDAISPMPLNANCRHWKGTAPDIGAFEAE